MNLHIKIWGYPSEPCKKALDDICLCEEDSPHKVDGMPEVLAYAAQLFHVGLNVMLVHHAKEDDAMWLCVDTRQFQTR